MGPKRVSVFGGSQTNPGEPAYQHARRLGELLAEAGYTVLTGGYIGTMEAISRGVVEAGGHTVGVTCDEIEAWRPIGPNEWVQEEVRFETLRERVFYLIENCDAAIALPGGIGTLAEIALMHSQLQTGAIPERPLILVGQAWKTLFDQFFILQHDYIQAKYRKLLNFAPHVESAFSTLQSLLAP